MDLKIIYEDNALLVIDKPAGIIVFSEGKTNEKTLAEYLLEKSPCLKNLEPPRCGIIHRLDKDTSGVLLIAKSIRTLDFFQKEFKNQGVNKKYLALIVGRLKEKQGIIESLIGRSPKDKRKQKIFPQAGHLSKGKRKAITKYKAIKEFKDFSLVEVFPKTGRKHQIRAHFSYLGHPIAGDKIYGFKNQPCPENLKRQFLHASRLEIKMPDGTKKEFYSELPEELNKILEKLNQNYE